MFTLIFIVSITVADIEHEKMLGTKQGFASYDECMQYGILAGMSMKPWMLVHDGLTFTFDCKKEVHV